MIEPPPPPSTDAEEAGSSASRNRKIVASAVLSASASYAAVLWCTGGKHDIAEDLVDLLHSLLCVRQSLRALRGASFGPQKVPHLTQSGDAKARDLMVASSTYFACDVCLIIQQLASGRCALWLVVRCVHACVCA